jgi:hypothetical protein
MENYINNKYINVSFLFNKLKKSPMKINYFLKVKYAILYLYPVKNCSSK